jgi:hypothetical protein
MQLDYDVDRRSCVQRTRPVAPASPGPFSAAGYAGVRVNLKENGLQFPTARFSLSTILTVILRSSFRILI